MLPANVPAVRVFPLCEWQYEATDAGLLALGVETEEMKNVAQTLDYRLDEQLLRDLRFMIREARPLLNDELNHRH